MTYSLPVAEKSWMYRVNQAIPTQSSVNSLKIKIIFEIKESLVWGKWIVQRSSNGSSVSNSDLWTSYSVVQPTANLSWIVIRNPFIDSIGQKFDICFTVATDGTTNAYLSPLGYDLGTGTTSARPSPLTNGDEISIGSSILTPTLNETTYLHCMQSSDGHCTRIFLSRLGQAPLCIILDKIKTDLSISDLPIPFVFLIHDFSSLFGWNANPGVALGSSTTTSPIGSLTLPYAYTRLFNGSSCMHLFPYVGGEYRSYDSFAKKYNVFKIQLFSESHGWTGSIGEFYDLWKGAPFIPNGTTFPSDNTKKFAMFSAVSSNGAGASNNFNLITPWNGTSLKV